MTSEHQNPPFISRRVAEGQYYFLDLDPTPNGPLRVACGGFERCQRDYVVDRQDFPFHSVEYVVAGSGRLVLGNRRHDLTAGSLFYYGPGLPHRIESQGPEPLCKYFVDFTGRNASELLAATALVERRPVRVEDPVRIHRIFQDLSVSGAAATEQSDRICRLLLELLLRWVAEQPPVVRHADGRAWRRYRLACQIIEAQFMTLRSLAELAERADLDQAYLCRLFRRFGHESPYQALIRRKMQWAAQALLQGEALVKQVARQVGFDDPYHFSKVFKQSYGTSPAAFVRQRRTGKHRLES